MAITATTVWWPITRDESPRAYELVAHVPEMGTEYAAPGNAAPPSHSSGFGGPMAARVWSSRRKSATLIRMAMRLPAFAQLQSLQTFFIRPTSFLSMSYYGFVITWAGRLRVFV